MNALTLYELNNMIREELESSFSSSYWLQAELSEVREAYNGHCYLEFVEKSADGHNLVAKARGTIWSSTYRLLKPYFERETGQAFCAGIKVLVCVEVAFHELYGMSLTVTDIDPAYTVGDFAMKRREILSQLSAEGVINDNKELTLPLLMNRIAVISSENAAGYGDFCDQLNNNDYGFSFKLKLFPAVMQGDKVESSVCSALERIFSEMENWDAVVIIRGGGATSDLSGFDTYLLAASCAQFPLPIITGIGHERDDTVIDMVAHTRVKTPTAAAAFIINHILETARELENISAMIFRKASLRMDIERSRLDNISARIPLLFSKIKADGDNKLNIVLSQLMHAWKRRVASEENLLKSEESGLKVMWDKYKSAEEYKLKIMEQQFMMSDPEAMLKRGYSITTCNGAVVRSINEVRAGDILKTQLYDGHIISEITEQ